MLKYSCPYTPILQPSISLFACFHQFIIPTFMSRHTPAQLPIFQAGSIYDHAANVPSPHTPFGTQRRGIRGAALEAALKQTINSLANLDFHQFFRVFHPHTFVYRYIEKFDCDQFAENIFRAFPVSKACATYSEVQATKDAKLALNGQLHLLICVFAQMQEARLNIGTIRSTLLWIGRLNYETYIALLNDEPVPHPLDSNPLPAPPRHVHWVSQHYLEPPLPAALTFHLEQIPPISVAVPTQPYLWTDSHSSHDQVSGHFDPQRIASNSNAASRWDSENGSSHRTRDTVGHKEGYVSMTHSRGSSPHFGTNGSGSSVRSRRSYDSDESHPPMYRHHSPVRAPFESLPGTSLDQVTVV